MNYPNGVLSAKELLEHYRHLSRTLLPEAEYKKIASSAMQEQQMNSLKETIPFERFFFVVNMHTCTLEHQHGIERWLGYPDKSFDFLNYLKLLHPTQVAGHNITSIKLIEGLMAGEWQIDFMAHRYVTNNIAIRHRDGHYIKCKRLAVIFQYTQHDGKHKLLEYLNEFTITDRQYKGEALSLGANDDGGEQLGPWLKTFLHKTREEFERKKWFSPQEQRILRKYAYEDVSVAYLARCFKVKESSIITHNKRILDKAENLYAAKLRNVKQVADRLKDEGLL